MLLMEKVGKLVRQNETFALAMILESKGSTPRHVGKMIVYRDGSIEGTVGGGLAEHYVIAESIKAIENGRSIVVEYKLNKNAKDGINMHCGGTLTVFIEVYTNRPEMVIVGAGHIAYALALQFDFLEYPYRVVDDRPEYCTRERFPNATSIHVHNRIESAVSEAKLDEKSFVIICTKDGDDRVLKKSLEYPCAYIGMIASKRKVLQIFNKLKELGCTEGQLEQVYTPIGFEIGAETVEEIAISIIVEIIKVSKGDIQKNKKLEREKLIQSLT
ncbi:XdhC family protein [Robertmurraya massiliosenegalensis]|uniref:XdhC family protein n=1 Tax=Robertmurraya massiliosenegalensis TaxID=1287657 RepID=UPI0002E90FD6|nr:XdhC family protein [Robertmurraya massiliosenegalensis]